MVLCHRCGLRRAKSAPDTEATAPIRRREHGLREQYDIDVPAHVNDKLAWEKARDSEVKTAKGERAAIKKALDNLGLEAARSADPTPHVSRADVRGAVQTVHQRTAESRGVPAEGGQFIGGHGMSPDNKLRTAAGLSDLWDGGVIRRVRSGEGTVILPGRRLCVHLMAQPAVADILFRDALLADQGLLSRMLVSAPERRRAPGSS